MTSIEQKPRKGERITLASGVVLDLHNFNAYALRSIEDCYETMSVLTEKTIEIEFQIDCYREGYHPDGASFSPERPPPLLWEPRAKKALAWTKLQKSETQQRIGSIAKREDDARKAQQMQQFEHCFLEAARTALDPLDFQRVKDVARAMLAVDTPSSEAAQ